MEHTTTKDRLLIFDGIAGILNACGKTVVFSYDICASGLGKMYTVAKKPSEMVKNLFVPQKCLLGSKESVQLLKEISMDGYKLNELYLELGRKNVGTTAPVDPSVSEEMQHLLDNIKEFRSRINWRKERVVELEGRETADLLLNKEIEAYALHTEKKAKRYRKDEQKTFETVKRAIDDAVEQGSFASESDRITFQTVANDLLNPSMDVKILAAAELGKMMCVTAINVLKEALTFNDPRLTVGIIKSLITIGDIRALPVFFENLSNPHYRVRIEALIGFSNLADEDEVVSSLLEALKDGRPEVRMTGATLLGWRKEFDAVAALVECINDKDEGVRKAVISALIHIGDKAALPFLIDRLGDKSRETREKALDAIKELSSEDIVFDVEAKGRNLTDAIKNVMSRLQETKASGATAEAVQKGVPKRTEPIRDVPVRPSKKIQAKKTPQELRMEVEQTIEDVREPPDKTTASGIISSKTRETSEPSRPLDIIFSAEILKKMVKPQLISLCKSLNIKCDYTDTRDQIIAKILERQGD